MALTMKDKFARIQLAKLPADVKSEAEMIRDITENFSDPDLCEAAQDNFDELYGIVIFSNHFRRNRCPKRMSK